MNKKWDGIEKRKSLRTEAERLLSSLSPTERTAQPAEILMHELLVHKVELEMQNEELRKAHTLMEEARDRYVDLYEFAPVGYITISREDLINEINLTGAALLGIDRNKLINRRFSKFVAPQDKDRWHRLFLNIMAHSEADDQSFDLRMIRADGSIFYAHLNCLRRQSVDAPPSLRLSVSDISLIKQAETELRIAATAFESQQGMFITDANIHILQVNCAFTKTTGYTAEEVIGNPPHLLSSKRHSTEFYANLWERVHRTGSWEGDIWDQRKNGEGYTVHLTLAAVKDTDGMITNYVATLTDITIDKQAAE